MIDYPVFDTHCHLFTLRYALKESKDMLKSWIRGDYDSHAQREVMKEINKESFISRLKIMLRQFYEFSSAAMGTEEKNMDFITSKAKDSWSSDQEVKIVPLMMDIFYMFSSPMEQGQKSKEFLPLTTNDMIPDGLDEDFEEILKDLKQYIQQNIPESTDKDIEQLNSAIQMIDEELEEGKTRKSRSITEGNYKFHQTSGYVYHLENLINLQKSRTGKIFPFLAVDPRRPGIVDTVKNPLMVSANGPFYGVKLYPRLGYHPLCEPLLEVYDYCKNNRIPITVHCGKSGFPPMDDWKYFDFCNPAYFEPVLDNDLIIDFAHLGSSDPSFEWADTIIQFISKYDNVYSDLSCYTNKDQIGKIKTKYWDNPKLRSRLMFGTDFDIMFATDKVTMGTYFTNFLEMFSPEELKVMTNVNPMKYLQLQ